MKNIRYILVALAVLVCSQTGMAQTAVSSYFLDGTLYNSRLNPAMKAERGYLSLGVGNTSLRLKGNVGMSNFLFPRGEDKLATFLSGSVTADEFLSGMPDAARLGYNFDETLMALGFRLFGGYFSFGVSLHSSTTFSMPKGFFEFAKKGVQNGGYSFSGLELNTMNYAATTVGYSHELFKGFRVGVNAKYLLGLAHANILVDKLNLEFSDQRWMLESHAQAQAALLCETRVQMDENNVITGADLALGNEDLISLLPSDGYAIDLGFVYDMKAIIPGLKISASVVDLGHIKWRYMMTGESRDAKVEYTGLGDIDYNNAEDVVNAELERLADDAMKLTEFTYNGSSEVKTGLNTTVYLGAEYNIPFFKRLSVGALYSKCISPFESNQWTETRGFVNFAPFKWLELSANYGRGTYGTVMGWMFNFHPWGINMFVGSDYMITRVTPQYIPIDNLNAHITFGLNMALGRRK